MPQQNSDNQDGGQMWLKKGQANQQECGKSDGSAQPESGLPPSHRDDTGGDEKGPDKNEKVGADPDWKGVCWSVSRVPEAEAKVRAERQPAADPATQAVVGAGMGNDPEKKDKEPGNEDSDEDGLHWCSAVSIGRLAI
ncbi:MAG TPA: hypothetical protein VMD29_00170 [Terracidiphilus sp.]|nr:hypothetical protein [Terracidiphilus sp.]